MSLEVHEGLYEVSLGVLEGVHEGLWVSVGVYESPPMSLEVCEGLWGFLGGL